MGKINIGYVGIVHEGCGYARKAKAWALEVLALCTAQTRTWVIVATVRLVKLHIGLWERTFVLQRGYIHIHTPCFFTCANLLPRSRGIHGYPRIMNVRYYRVLLYSVMQRLAGNVCGALCIYFHHSGVVTARALCTSARCGFDPILQTVVGGSHLPSESTLFLQQRARVMTNGCSISSGARGQIWTVKASWSTPILWFSSEIPTMAMCGTRSYNSE